MCLIALAWDAHPRFDLVLAANRDEFLDRATAPLHRWPDGTLAGRDLKAGGTWMGLTDAGRLAMLTNVRRPGAVRADAPSRGGIVMQWLHGGATPAAFCAELAGAGHNPFNLIAGDVTRGELFWTGSDHPAPHPLAPGLHAVSNAVLDTPWPKLRHLKEGLAQALQEHDRAEGLIEALLRALSHRERAADAELPSTGVPLELERGLSSVFIDLPHYGTRSSTVLVRERDSQRLLMVELTHGPQSQRRRMELPQWPTVSTGALPANAAAIAS